MRINHRAQAKAWGRRNGYDLRRSDTGRRREAYYNAKGRAKRKGVPFTIALSDVPTIPETCPVLGIALEIANAAANGYSPSLDRVIPALGYVPGNIMWISNRANSIKNDATWQELRKVADFYEHHATNM